MEISLGTVFVFIVFCYDLISARNDTLCHQTSTLDRAKRCVGFEGFPRLRLEQSPKFEPKFIPAKPWPKDHKHPTTTYKYIQESGGGGQPLILKPMSHSKQQSPHSRPTYKYVQESDGGAQPLILKPMYPSNRLSPSDRQGEHSNSKHRNDLRPGNRSNPKYRSNVLTANNSSSNYRPISSHENITSFKHRPNRHHVIPNFNNRLTSSNGLRFEDRANKPFREHSTYNHRSNMSSLNAPDFKYRPNLSPRDVASSTDRKNLRPGNQPRRSRQRNTSTGNHPNGASSNTHPQFPPNTGMEEKEQGKFIHRPYKSATFVRPPSGSNEVSLQEIRNSPDFKNLHDSPARKGKYEYRKKQPTNYRCLKVINSFKENSKIQGSTGVFPPPVKAVPLSTYNSSLEAAEESHKVTNLPSNTNIMRGTYNRYNKNNPEIYISNNARNPALRNHSTQISATCSTVLKLKDIAPPECAGHAVAVVR